MLPHLISASEQQKGIARHFKVCLQGQLTKGMVVHLCTKAQVLLQAALKEEGPGHRLTPGIEADAVVQRDVQRLDGLLWNFSPLSTAPAAVCTKSGWQKQAREIAS